MEDIQYVADEDFEESDVSDLEDYNDSSEEEEDTEQATQSEIEPGMATRSTTRSKHQKRQTSHLEIEYEHEDKEKQPASKKARTSNAASW